ncbi:MAG: DNA polymerase IV [gamma proteobacterium endosymbiont of Lamellibrachia anaximandri]|nr:DNA polymerase IV [gamma proteobacterium endosymbiont of Lamellibrachia anaximandri]MBL3534111.1 DNA polymerase IV [gamma proteobacterium endosymbiont of Lamellibrachia anaximandri]
MTALKDRRWQRVIILMDMDAFFASVEQRDHPEWRGRAIGITNGQRGTCIITCSYEARALGIKTGMRVREALQICPDFIQVPASPERYAAVSTRIMHVLQTITPDLEIFSVDEAFLDVTHCQRLYGSPERIGRLVKTRVEMASGVRCSVGVSGDKTTAKWAAKQGKPDGFVLIPPWEARYRLREVPVTELCGIADGVGRYLAERGVYRCGDMARLPIGELGRRFGNQGRRIWYMCQGEDPERVETRVAPPKSIGHGKVMPPDTRDLETIQIFLLHMSEKVAARLRRHELQASRFFVGLRAGWGWIGVKRATPLPTSDGRRIMALCRETLCEQWQGEGVSQVQVTALDPRPVCEQLELFGMDEQAGSGALHRVVDQTNARYGEFAIAPARLLKRSDMPNVIAPSWKPFGHRQSI